MNYPSNTFAAYLSAAAFLYAYNCNSHGKESQYRCCKQEPFLLKYIHNYLCRSITNSPYGRRKIEICAAPLRKCSGMEDIMEPARTLNEYTTEDIYALPDGERAELINGEIYMMALPNRRHQELVHQLSWEIESYIRKNNGDCEVYPAPFAVFLNRDNRNYVEPDISVICDKNKLDDRGCNGAPDWVVEIVSPGSRRMDYSIKVFKYRSAGVREYWIIDPDKNRVMVWNFEDDSMEEYSFSDSIKAGIFDDFAVQLSEIE